MNKSILHKQIEHLLEESNIIAALANVSACINDNLNRVNWVGFYFTTENDLVLGPFQGKVACTHIPFGKGVCGTSVKEKRGIIVDDVHQFPGHIACDSASQSELVAPLIFDNVVYGVLDIDSPELNRFTQEELEEFNSIAILIAQKLHSQQL
ncbi:MAG: GAF domain-containing protein [Anaerorhabdus sp.]